MTTRTFASRALALVVSTAILITASGCHYINTNVTASSFPSTGAGSPIPQDVTLVLDDKFVTYDHQFHRGGDAWHYPIGPALEAYAKAVASRHFKTVTASKGGTPASAASSLTLTPTVKRVDVTLFATIFDSQQMTIDVEWTLRKSGLDAPLWISTFEGNGDGGAASEKVVDRALMDLWKKTDDGFGQLHRLEQLQK